MTREGFGRIHDNILSDEDWVMRQPCKVELHRHLEGSIRPETMWRLQQAGAVDLGFRSQEELETHVVMAKPLQDWDVFFAKFEPFQKVFLQGGVEATREIVADEVAYAADHEGIDLLELRFSPGYMSGEVELGKQAAGGHQEYPSSWDDYMRAIIDGCGAGSKGRNIRVGLIPIVSRRLGSVSGLMVAAFARRWRDHVIGFDFADDESKQTTLELVDTAAAAHQMGLPLTVHTGEGCSVDHIEHTLDCFGSAVRRLGHATTLLDSPSLVEKCRKEGIAIEACPTSNYLMGCIPRLTDHPLPAFLQQGIVATVNTDDPTLFGTDMNGEWLSCLNQRLLTREELLKANQSARDVSFINL